MHEVVQPVTPVPSCLEDNSRFSHVVVDVVQGRDLLFHIIYLATVGREPVVLQVNELVTCGGAPGYR
ncbi:Semaphorin-5A [Fukomys damarensis]|uniref:Semaphorin-5A n=1 Tax=Fukomys damarensis TaxID=885580 RepID=A0A091E509_FUKDA|nr:Semaphorin-5A [Fukomys damarensis]